MVNCPQSRKVAQAGLGCKAVPSQNFLPCELRARASQDRLDQGCSHLPLRWEERVSAGGTGSWVMWPCTPGDTRRDPAKGTVLCSCCWGAGVLPAQLGRDQAARAGFAPRDAGGDTRSNPGLINEALLQMQIGVMPEREHVPESRSERRRGTPVTSPAPPTSAPVSGSPSLGGQVSH